MQSCFLWILVIFQQNCCIIWLSFSYECPESECALLQMGKFAYFVSVTIFTLSALGNAKATSFIVSSGSVRPLNTTPISEGFFTPSHDHEHELLQFYYDCHL